MSERNLKPVIAGLTASVWPGEEEEDGDVQRFLSLRFFSLFGSFNRFLFNLPESLNLCIYGNSFSILCFSRSWILKLSLLRIKYSNSKTHLHPSICYDPLIEYIQFVFIILPPPKKRFFLLAFHNLSSTCLDLGSVENCPRKVPVFEI